MGRFAGHYWTFRPYLGHLLRPAAPPTSRCFRALADDPLHGEVPITGRLSGAPGGELCVIVHGLGGSSRSHYVIRAARDAHAAGMATLRLDLRGADRSGADIYHAGLTADLHATLASPRLASYDDVYLLGFSVGGHVVLRYLAEGADPRIRGAAAICPPLDLAAGAAEIDRRRRTVYRRHVLRGLKEIYAAVTRRRGPIVPLAEAMKIDTIRSWDERIVAPRFGFEGAEDYWARTTVVPLLDRISLPTLAVIASHDPVVLAHTVRPALERARSLEVVYVDEAGHLGFPGGVDLGLRASHAAATTLAAPSTMDRQVIDWLRRAHASAASQRHAIHDANESL